MSIGVWIRTRRGYTALVDREDQDLADLVWYRTPLGYFNGFPRGYQTKDRRVPYLSLHRVILERVWGSGMVADHANGDKMDNRRSNLRWCTHAQNGQNRRRGVNRSGYKGVYWHQNTRHPYRVILGADGRKFNLGAYATAEEAAHVYDAAARQHHGEFAALNFPQGT